MYSQIIGKIAFGVLTIGFALTQLPADLRAQSTFGNIVGVVRDASQSVMPGAQVTLHSLDENTNLTAVSDDRGAFTFENLKPGHYTVTAAKEGFATAAVQEQELTARQSLRVDVTLAVASQAQTVEVSANAEAVNTENATLADSKKNSDITALPLNSRAVSTSPLAALATSASVVKDSQGNIAVGGAVSSQVGYSVDGIHGQCALEWRSAGRLSFLGRDRGDESHGIQQ
jgi:23S rRNA pseudoU1915 N3-methylase RlmH